MEAGKKSNKKAQATAEGFTTLVAYPTMTALLIAGVWHGAGLQFLLYGLMHGCYLTINHAWRTFVPANSAARRMMTPAAGAALTFFAVVLSFVMFRADGTASALADLQECVWSEWARTRVVAREGSRDCGSVGRRVAYSEHAGNSWRTAER